MGRIWIGGKDIQIRVTASGRLTRATKWNGWACWGLIGNMFT